MGIISLREVGAVMNAATFGAGVGGGGDKPAAGEHVLKLPTRRRGAVAADRVEHLVHHIPTPEVNDFPCFDESFAIPFDAGVSPHHAAQTAANVGDVEFGAVAEGNIVTQALGIIFAHADGLFRRRLAGALAERKTFQK